LIKLKETIVVEGRYDKARLANLFDAPILETGGFGIFRDKQRLALLRRLAQSSGIILLTDSDMAGFKIRSYIAGAIPNGRVVHVYIPDVYGKESRKAAPSAEGKLGVEGIEDTLILEAFETAGLLGAPCETPARPITKLDLYEDGLSGGENSAEKRRALCAALHLPARLGVNSLVKVLNSIGDYEMYKNVVDTL
jgi:ribonuclease M5